MKLTKEYEAKFYAIVASFPHNDLFFTVPIAGCQCSWCESKRKDIPGGEEIVIERDESGTITGGSGAT